MDHEASDQSLYSNILGRSFFIYVLLGIFMLNVRGYNKTAFYLLSACLLLSTALLLYSFEYSRWWRFWAGAVFYGATQILLLVYGVLATFQPPEPVAPGQRVLLGTLIMSFLALMVFVYILYVAVFAPFATCLRLIKDRPLLSSPVPRRRSFRLYLS